MFQASRWKRLAPLRLFCRVFPAVLPLGKDLSVHAALSSGVSYSFGHSAPCRFFQERLRMPRGGAALAATTLALVALCGSLALLGVLAVRELTAFLTRASQTGFAEFSQPVADFLEQAEGFLGQLDLSFLERHRQELLDALQNSMELVTACARAALDLVTSLPTVVTLVIVTVCAAFFFTRDMKGFLSWGRGFFSDGAARHVSAAVKILEGQDGNMCSPICFSIFSPFARLA